MIELINDIKLTRNRETNKYDWTFNNGDIEVVTGEPQLSNAAKHAILLKRYELLQKTYSEKGCDAHSLVRKGASPNILNMAEESIILAVKDIKGVKDAKVDANYKDGIQIQQLTLIRDDGSEVEVNAI